ncbi:hypothetical protein [Halpernia frigidisoli]|uniref:Antimicrobial peptide, SdpC family n=1 Tax=Halpernia frigidisoli TaxID=1125876 RepID=A0A1I3IHF3_9FLAO|nr:hypothetical protein [Halpernia frigidisoli]SFI47257.1 antimicrobial peptide, SdpC family [Halpernia frigidisoli]
MKKIRRISQNPYFIVLILFNFLFVSCNRSNDVDNFEKPEEVSGKVLFNEIVFGTSNKLNLDHVNEMNAITGTLDKKQKDLYIKTINKIDDKILEQNPKYFDEFKSDLYSKDHYRISASIEDLKTVIEKALMAIPELRDSYVLGMKIAKNVDVKVFTNEDGTLNQQAFKDYMQKEYGDKEIESLIGPTFIGVAVYIALAVSVGVAVNIGAFVFCYYYVRNNCNKMDLSNSKLKNEILVNQIYEKL